MAKEDTIAAKVLVQVRTIVINLEDLFARKLWELNRKLPRTNSFWFFRITALQNQDLVILE